MRLVSDSIAGDMEFDTPEMDMDLNDGLNRSNNLLKSMTLMVSDKDRSLVSVEGPGEVARTRIANYVLLPEFLMSDGDFWGVKEPSINHF